MAPESMNREYPGGENDPRPVWFVNGWATEQAHMLVQRGWASAVVGMHQGIFVPDEARQIFTEMFLQVLRSGDTILAAVREGLAAVHRWDANVPRPYFFYGNPVATVEFAAEPVSEDAASEEPESDGLSAWLWPIGEPDSRAQWEVAQGLGELCWFAEMGMLASEETARAALSPEGSEDEEKPRVRTIDTGNATRDADIVVVLTDGEVRPLLEQCRPDALVIEVGHEDEPGEMPRREPFDPWPPGPAGLMRKVPSRPGFIPGDPGVLAALRSGGQRALYAIGELCDCRMDVVDDPDGLYEELRHLSPGALAVLAARALRRRALRLADPGVPLTIAALAEYVACTNRGQQGSAASSFPIAPRYTGGETVSFIDGFSGLSDMLRYVIDGGPSERMNESIVSALGQLVGTDPDSMMLRCLSHDLHFIGNAWVPDTTPLIRNLPGDSATYYAPPPVEESVNGRVLVVGSGEDEVVMDAAARLGGGLAEAGHVCATFARPGPESACGEVMAGSGM
ncbi:MAG: hypothetical protein KDA21_15450, partial [Phycisphaerales bacterium]|nr:hypothetical protein [Phycisphaerales bacterium]